LPTAAAQQATERADHRESEEANEEPFVRHLSRAAPPQERTTAHFANTGPDLEPLHQPLNFSKIKIPGILGLHCLSFCNAKFFPDLLLEWWVAVIGRPIDEYGLDIAAVVRVDEGIARMIFAAVFESGNKVRPLLVSPTLTSETQSPLFLVFEDNVLQLLLKDQCVFVVAKIRLITIFIG